MTNRRRDSATALVGLGTVGAGAEIKERGIAQAHRKLKRTTRMKPPGWAIIPAKVGRGRYLLGSGIMAGGATAAAVGTSNTFRVRKAEPKRRSYLREGVSGANDALRERADNIREPVPTRHRATAVGAGLAAGGAGAQLAHLGVNRVARLGRFRSPITAVSGTLAATASIPATSRRMQRQSKGEYVVTPTGVRRTKTKAVPASRRAAVIEARPGRGGHPAAVRQALVPSDRRVRKLDTNYPGAKLTTGQKRRRVYAAGSTPVIGDYAAAAAAGRMAPPELRNKTVALQFGGSQVGGAVGGALGAYGLAQAARSNRVNAKAQSAHRKVERVKTKARNVRPVRAVSTSRPAAVARRGQIRASNAVRDRIPVPGSSRGRGAKLTRAFTKPMKARPAAAAMGFLAGSTAGAQVGGWHGYGAALRMEQRRNAKISKVRDSQSARHGSRVSKTNSSTGMSPRQEAIHLKRKRHAAVLGVTASTTGLAALGTLGASALPRLSPKMRGRLVSTSTKLGVTAGGFGGASGLRGAQLDRRAIRARERQIGVKKSDQLKVTMSHAEAKRQAALYGTKGPLPKTLDRPSRMKAYEGRYIASGGRKGEKWNRRANVAEVSRNAGLATATSAGALLLGRRHAKLGRQLTRGPLKRVRSGHLEVAGLAGGTGAGASELYGEYARHKRSSSTSAPAGVAASALRRMRAYTPED